MRQWHLANSATVIMNLFHIIRISTVFILRSVFLRFFPFMHQCHSLQYVQQHRLYRTDTRAYQQLEFLLRSLTLSFIDTIGVLWWVTIMVLFIEAFLELSCLLRLWSIPKSAWHVDELEVRYFCHGTWLEISVPWQLAHFHMLHHNSTLYAPSFLSVGPLPWPIRWFRKCMQKSKRFRLVVKYIQLYCTILAVTLQ